MASLEDHGSSNSIKMLLVGPSGAGKTCSYISLAEAGYKVRILDLDNGIPALKRIVLDPKSPYKPHTKNNFDSIITLTEKMKSVGGNPMPAGATVFPKVVNLLASWKDGETAFGPITSWGEDVVLVIDSGSRLGDAAYNYCSMMNGSLGKDLTGFEYQRINGAAQQKCLDILRTVTDDHVKCHVIVVTHIVIANTDGSSPKDDDGKERKGFPSFIGKKSAPTTAPQFFNNVLEVCQTGTRRIIRTAGSTLIDLKNVAPLSAKREYLQERGLAEFFKEVLGKDGPHVAA